jgi:hypothetical protein
MIAYRKSIYPIIALSILLVMPSLGTSMREAHARISTQGTRLQGTRLQGTRLQGTRIQGAKIQGAKIQAPATGDHWLRGPQLIGVLTHAADGARWQLAPCTRPRPDEERASGPAWLHVWSQRSATQGRLVCRLIADACRARGGHVSPRQCASARVLDGSPPRFP